MHPDRIHASGDAESDRRQRALQPVLDGLIEDGADETLARGADQHRQAKSRSELAQTAEDRDADGRQLGETEAGVDDQARSRDTGRRRGSDALGEAACKPLDRDRPAPRGRRAGASASARRSGWRRPWLATAARRGS